MKRTLYIITILLAGMAVLYACTKNTLKVPYNYVDGQSQVKFNIASAYKANPAIQIKLNDVRISPAISYPYPYPGGGLNTNGGSTPDYFSVAAGSIKVSIAVPKAGSNEDSVALYTTNVSVDANKYFTVHVADTGANTQTVLVPEDVASPDSGYSKYKFVNLMPNLAAIDLYFGTTLVAANIPYKGVSPTFTLVSTSGAQWIIRPAGAAAGSTPITTYPTGTTLNVVPNQRVLTVFARGYNGIAGTTDIRRPQVSLFFNR